MDLSVPLDLPRVAQHLVWEIDSEYLAGFDLSHETIPSSPPGDRESRRYARMRARKTKSCSSTKPCAEAWAKARKEEKPLLLGPLPLATPR